LLARNVEIFGLLELLRVQIFFVAVVVLDVPEYTLLFLTS